MKFIFEERGLMSVKSIVKKTLGLILILYGLLTIPSGISILGNEWAWGIGRIIGGMIFVVAGLYLVEVWPFEKDEED